MTRDQAIKFIREKVKAAHPAWDKRIGAVIGAEGKEMIGHDWTVRLADIIQTASRVLPGYTNKSVILDIVERWNRAKDALSEQETPVILWLAELLKKPLALTNDRKPHVCGTIQVYRSTTDQPTQLCPECLGPVDAQ